MNRAMKNLTALLLALILVAGCTCAVAEGDPWTCPECWNENTTKFCTKCGAKKPDEIICPGCGMKYAYDTDAVFCGECGTKLREEAAEIASDRYEGNGFDTPEDAALYYVAGLKNLDLEQMLSAFAWETQADRFDFKAMLTRIRGISPTNIPGMPVCNELSRSAAVEQLRGAQTNCICTALEYYINDELYSSVSMSGVFREEAEFENYLRRCNNGNAERLTMMRDIRLYHPDDVTDGKFSIGKNPQNFLKQTAQYGGDAVKNVFVAFDIAGRTYAVAPTAVCYGGRWYLVSAGSMLSNILGISYTEQAFFVVPDTLKAWLDNASPYSVTNDLPAGKAGKISYEGEGFNTPAEAVNCYFEGLKNGSVQQMLQAFAWETQAGRYSLKEYVHWLHTLHVSAPVRMQLDNPFMTELNLGSLRYYQSRKIYAAIRQFILEEEDNVKAQGLITNLQVDLKEEEEIDAFIQCFDNGKADKLKRLGNVRLLEPGTLIERYNTDSVRNQLDSYQRIFGADEILETLAVADLEGETLIFDPVLVRYGNKWYIATIHGAAFSVLGIEANRQALLHIKGPVSSLLLTQ